MASIAAAEFPDVDIVLGSSGTKPSCAGIASFTHSAVLLAVLAALMAWVFWNCRVEELRFLFAASVAG